jgi:hypothetical protein
MRSNSRKDPVMVSAADRLRLLLGKAADAAQAALDGYLAGPRWCGLPAPDLDPKLRGLCSHPNYPMYWPLNQWMVDQALAPFGGRVPEVTDEISARRYHTLAINALVLMFRDGMMDRSPVWNEEKQDYDRGGGVDRESPRTYIDRIRGELRYSYRFDAPNVLTKTFALLKCVEEGRPRRPDYWSEKEQGVPPLVQRYAYVPLPSIEMRLLPGIQDLADAMKEAFDHCALSLMPQRLNAQQRVFLEWIVGRGGQCRQVELIDWMLEDKVVRGTPDDGQGPERKLLRMFCDKDGRPFSRKGWVVRPEARLLLESI